MAVAKGIRETNPGTAIVFFSGSVGQLENATTALADGVLPKPFTLEALTETAQRLARP